jgi:tetratricopeptide (TPR) repeat protein
MDYSAIGDTTNLASRLQTQAEPGDILVHETTARLVQGDMRLETLAPIEVRGKTEPVSIYKVIGTLPRRSPIARRNERTLSQFVGRERELATLEELFYQVETGSGQIVGIVAEAGGGKSRLLYEFRQRLADKQVTYLEGRCLSYGQTIPYHPIIDILRHNCDIRETDGPESIAEKVGFALQELEMDSEEAAPYLLHLLGIQEGTASIAQLTPEAVRTRTFEFLRQMSLKGSQKRPLILEIEDLHWIDHTSQDYLASLVENLPGASMLLLTTYRPGYHPQWLDKSYATQLSLHSLARPDALNVMHSIRRHAELPEHLEQTIIAKAEGNPFFLEELTRAVIEHGDFQVEMVVPDTIQGVLSARIDRLPEEHKRLLQTASVLGREFPLRLLEEIWDGSGSLDALLSDLKRLELIFEQAGAEETQYVFKHALTQDVAYESLLMARRQMLHAVVGQTLEMLYEDRLEDIYDRLSYHYARTDNAAKAVAYLTRFAEQVAARYAREEALTILQEACQHAERLPAPERQSCALDLAIRQGRLLPEMGRTQEALELLLAQQAYVEHLQNPLSAAQYYHRLGFVYNSLGAWERALQSAQRCLEEASQCGQEAILGQAHYVLMMVINFIGQPRRALGHGQQAIPLLERTHEWYWLGEVYFWFAFISIRLGNFEQALQSAARTKALGKTIGNRKLQWRGACMAQLTYVTKGEWDQALTCGQRALELATGPHDASWTSASLGYAHLAQGHVAKAISLLERVVNQEAYLHAPQQQGWFAAWLGEAYAAQGRIEEAQAVVLRGLHLTRESEYWIGVGIALRALARIKQASGSLAEAESHLREALQTFADRGFRPEAARTHLDLAMVVYDQGDRDRATTHLSTAHAWFTKLQVPKWVEKTEQLAREYGVMLAEVELEELTEDAS